MKFLSAFENVSAKLSQAKFSYAGDDFAIQVTMSNKDCGGTFYIEVKDGALNIQPYDYYDNAAAIDIMYGDFTKLIDKKLSVDNAVESEKLKFFGNIEALKTLVDAITPAEAPKKTAVKKTVKKEAEKPVKTTKTK